MADLKGIYVDEKMPIFHEGDELIIDTNPEYEEQKYYLIINKKNRMVFPSVLTMYGDVCYITEQSFEVELTDHYHVLGQSFIKQSF